MSRMPWWAWLAIAWVAVVVFVFALMRIAKQTDEDNEMAWEEFMRRHAHERVWVGDNVYEDGEWKKMVPESSSHWHVEMDGTMVQTWKHTGHIHVKRTLPDGTVLREVQDL